MLIAVLLTGSYVFAYDFEVDGIYYDIISTDDMTVRVTYKDTNYNSYTGDVVIPSTVTSGDITYTVAEIGSGAFYDCTGLTSVTIPSSVSSIDDDAFEGCSSLTNVALGNNVASIGDYAFQSCTSLTSITIPNGVITIGARAFNKCSGLTSVTLSSSIETIGDYAFYNCTNISDVISEAKIPPIAQSSIFKNAPTDATLYVPKEQHFCSRKKVDIRMLC